MKRYILTAATFLACTANVFAGVSHAQSANEREAIGGFNLFTVAQDIEIGRQSANVAQRQLAFLGVAAADKFANQIVKKLASVAPGGTYPYTARVLNGADLNAFSLPGGPIYLNRGLVEATRNEAELAAAIAHEMGHIALRHGTTNISNAYLGKKGMGLLGGFEGTSRITATTIVVAVGGMGLNATFLNYSRDNEQDADRAGAEMLARAGYGPSAMADFQVLLRETSAQNPDQLELYFGSHPPAPERETRVRTLSATLTKVSASEIGDHAKLRKMMAKKPYSSASSGILPAPVSTPNPPLATPATPATPVQLIVPAPSARLTQYQQPTGFITVSFPDNWHAIGAPGQFAATVAPVEGMVALPNGQKALAYGVIINHYYPFEGAESRWDASLTTNYTPFQRGAPPRGTLEDATDDLIRTILGANVYLKAVAGSVKAETVNGVPSYSALLAGVSPITGVEERVKVYTRMLPDNHVLFALGVAPARDFPTFESALSQLIQSLVVHEDLVHGVSKAARKK